MPTLAMLKQGTRGISVLLVCLLLITVFGIAVVSHRSNRELSPKERELLRILDETTAIELELVKDCFEITRKGEPLFDESISMIKEAVLQGPKERPRGQPWKARLFDKKGNVSKEIDVYFKWIVVDGVSFRMDGGGMRNSFDKTASKRLYCYPSGKKKADGTHDVGKKVGHWIYYYETGEKMSEGHYVQGKKDGKWVEYDKQGKVVKEEMFKDGVLVEDKPH